MEFDRTFDEQYPALLRYCFRLTGDSDVAQDIAQEALVRLFEHDVEGPPQAVRGWLFKTATHLVRDRYRVEQNRGRLLAMHPVKPSGHEAPDVGLEREEERRSARAALDALPARDREILLLRYSGFSYKEIAETVEVAAASVGTLLARAERRFAQEFTGVEEHA